MQTNKSQIQKPKGLMKHRKKTEKQATIKIPKQTEEIHYGTKMAGELVCDKN